MALDNAKERDDDRMNSGFAQVYPKGWARLRWLLREKPTAAALYTWFAEHVDPNGGALVVSQAVIAERMGLSEITIRRLTGWMEEHHCIARVRVGTGVYAYALDPDEIWKSWDSAKEYAVFRTKTLVSKRDKHNQTVARRIQMMLKEPPPEAEVDEVDSLIQATTASETPHDPETGEVL